MRNLARLTAAANRIEHGPAPAKRTGPKCAECRRVCQQMPDGTYQPRCWKHQTPDEWQAYKQAWQPIWKQQEATQ
jgi:hypothetical protein